MQPLGEGRSRQTISMFIQLYHAILYQPLFNLLVWLYNIIPGKDIGIAIVALTIIIKLVLHPFSKKSITSQRQLQSLQPKIDELRSKFKDEKEKQAQALMELYRKEKVNPLSSCLPLLIQLPFFIAMYQVFRSGLATSESLQMLYSFVANPGSINHISFGVVDLAVRSIPLAVVAGAAQFWQTKMLVHKRQPQVPGSKDENMMASMNKQMMYVMPAMTVVIGMSLPAGLMLYWLTTSVLTVAQQWWMFRKDGKEKETELVAGRN